ncbi:cysteine-rich CWC family protein [Vibrio vulnificus]|nr:cysteine-rich CWC family protein [Vibrio vulnificus]
MKSPCVGACKNNNGLCQGCHRTMNEITHWKSYTNEQRKELILQIKGCSSTHQCPTCKQPAQCDLLLGKSHCWCFDVERREIGTTSEMDQCLCRQCLEKASIS